METSRQSESFWRLFFWEYWKEIIKKTFKKVLINIWTCDKFIIVAAKPTAKFGELPKWL